MEKEHSILPVIQGIIKFREDKALSLPDYVSDLLKIVGHKFHSSDPLLRSFP
jgi:hypothetical protein